VKRFLLLGEAQLDVKWLLIKPTGNVTMRQIIPAKLYMEMPQGFVGTTKGFIVNVQLSAISLEVEADTHLAVVPDHKLPENLLSLTLENP
jgi:hypothetical protein